MGTKAKTRAQKGTRRIAARPARRVVATRQISARRKAAKRRSVAVESATRDVVMPERTQRQARPAPTAKRALAGTARTNGTVPPAEARTPRRGFQSPGKKPVRAKSAKAALPPKPRVRRKIALRSAEPTPDGALHNVESSVPAPRRRRGGLAASKTAPTRKPRVTRSRPTPPMATASAPVATTDSTPPKPPRRTRSRTPLKTEPSPLTGVARPSVPQETNLKIPPILLAGDHPPPVLLEGPGERFALSANPSVAAAPRVEPQLPEGYGTKRLFLTARDPEWLYAHWDLTREQQRVCNTQSSDGHLVLRVYSEAVSGEPLAEVHVHPESRYWFVHVGRGGETFAAELGYYQAGEVWKRVAASEPARTPVGAPSRDRQIEFATIPADVPLPRLLALTRKAGFTQMPLARAVEALRAKGHREFPLIPAPPPAPLTPEQEAALAQLVNLPGAERVGAGSVEIGELVRGEQSPSPEWPVLPADAVGSPSSPFGGRAAGEKTFWFNVNAELILYGATEPDATVTIGGQPVELQPDGSFRCRFALPDGSYTVPVVAVSAENTEGRTADLRFTRETTCCGAVGEASQDSALQPPPPENV